MERLGLTFHHMGLAAHDGGDAELFLTAMGYKRVAAVFDPLQNVNLRLYSSEFSPTVEVVLPGDGEGPLTPILKQYNELIYHTCYEVESLEQSLTAIEDLGLRILPVSEPKPALLFDGRKVSFYKVMGFGLIELLEGLN